MQTEGYKDNSGYANNGKHPNSLANLVPGGKAGHRAKLTKSFVQATVDFLQDNREEFERRMASLSDRDYVAAYLKMAELVTPKKTDLTVDAPPVIDWTLNVVPKPALQAKIDDAKALNKPADFEPLTDAEVVEDE